MKVELINKYWSYPSVFKVIDYNQIEPGTVFEREDGTIAIKVYPNNAVEIATLHGHVQFEIEPMSGKTPIAKVLGKLIGLEVE